VRFVGIRHQRTGMRYVLHVKSDPVRIAAFYRQNGYAALVRVK
jgi:hypothetical protein